jgi:hypothetical protein
MRIAGGVLAVVAGILSFIAAMGTGMFSSASDHPFATHVNAIIGFGDSDAVFRNGLILSVLVIAFGACVITSRARRMSYFLLVSSSAGGILGGPMVAGCMALAFISGLLSLLGKRSDIPPPL